MSQPRSPEAERLFEAIRAACPSFVLVDDANEDDWQDEPNPLDYVRMSGLARHLTQLASEGRIDLVVPVSSTMLSSTGTTTSGTSLPPVCSRTSKPIC
jgi:hypothetical protein